MIKEIIVGVLILVISGYVAVKSANRRRRKKGNDDFLKREKEMSKLFNDFRCCLKKYRFHTDFRTIGNQLVYNDREESSKKYIDLRGQIINLQRAKFVEFLYGENGNDVDTILNFRLTTDFVDFLREEPTWRL